MYKSVFNFTVILLLFASCTRNELNISKDSSTNESMQKAPYVGEPIKVTNTNVEIAEEVAKLFFALANKQEAKTLEILSIDSIADWKGKTAMYVFNLQPKGYVLTSADFRNKAIIGFSEEGYFSADPKDMSPVLISTIAEIIVDNRNEIDGEPNMFDEIWDKNKSNWENLYCLAAYNKKYKWICKDPCFDSPRQLVGVRFSNPMGYFCKTVWHQWEPYNYNAPKYDYPIGCVAVAIGQIMKFHHNPSWFNWEIMPNRCTSSYSQITAGEKEVARLLRDIGWKTNMTYSESGSGATDYMAWWALYYKYHYWADVPQKWDYNKITNQLKNDKTPIYAGGYAERYKRGCWIFKWYTYERGHAFVLDGIQEMVTTYKYYCTDGIKIGTEKEELIHYNIGGEEYDKFGNKYASSVFWLVHNKNRIPADQREDLQTQDDFTNYQYKKVCIYNISPK